MKNLTKAAEQHTGGNADHHQQIQDWCDSKAASF